MKILKIEYENIGLFNEGLAIDFTASDRVVDKDYVDRIYKSIYTQNVIGIVGINATGKTTALNLIKIAMDIVLGNKGLNEIDIPFGIIKDQTILKVFFYLEDNIYMLKSIIGIHDSKQKSLSMRNSCFFEEEIIQVKSKTSVTSKKRIFDFSKAKEEIRRSKIAKNEKFLKKQDSIVAAITKDISNLYIDMIFDTNFSFIRNEGEVKKEYINLFDKGIECINKEDSKISIKFKSNSNSIETDSFAEASKIISSGTIKGVNILENIYNILKFGGYLILDEIENHMHKKLVQTIIRFFTDPRINKFGATLIFSTHYIEIIDTLERKDNIYILRRPENDYCESIKYSDVIERNDIKKSEVFLSNMIGGTSPKYEDILKVRKLMCH